jgi:hypothetical protein
MMHPADFVFWILLTLLFAIVILLLAARGQLRNYASLSFYFTAAIANNIALMLIFQKGGSASPSYLKWYFLMDCLKTMLLYCVVAGLYQKTIFSKHRPAHVRIASIVLVAVIAIFVWGQAMGLTGSSRSNG